MSEVTNKDFLNLDDFVGNPLTASGSITSRPLTNDGKIPCGIDITGAPMIEFKSGARRSSKALRYDLIPAAGLERLAQRYTLGAERYGDWNWQKGLQDTEYVNQFKAHLLAHWVAYLRDGCTKDDNLAAIAWGAFALMEAEAQSAKS